MLIAEIVLLTRQKLFPSRKINLEERKTGGTNENSSLKRLKSDINVIVAPFIYAKQKWLLTTGDPKEEALKSSTFLISYKFETTP